MGGPKNYVRGRGGPDNVVFFVCVFFFVFFVFVFFLFFVFF